MSDDRHLGERARHLIHASDRDRLHGRTRQSPGECRQLRTERSRCRSPCRASCSSPTVRACRARTAARAISTMSVTSGESFVKIGCVATRLTPRITDPVASGSDENICDRSSRFGHEMFTSIATTPGALRSRRRRGCTPRPCVRRSTRSPGPSASTSHGSSRSQNARDTGVLQTDRVEHPGRRLGSPRRRMTRPRLGRQALHDHTAELLEIDVRRELLAVVEAARRRQDRVREPQTARGRPPSAARRGVRSSVLTPRPAVAAGTGVPRLAPSGHATPRTPGPSVQHRAQPQPSALSSAPAPRRRGTHRTRTPSPLPTRPGTASSSCAQTRATARSIGSGPQV